MVCQIGVEPSWLVSSFGQLEFKKNLERHQDRSDSLIPGLFNTQTLWTLQGSETERTSNWSFGTIQIYRGCWDHQVIYVSYWVWIEFFILTTYSILFIGDIYLLHPITRRDSYIHIVFLYNNIYLYIYLYIPIIINLFNSLVFFMFSLSGDRVATAWWPDAMDEKSPECLASPTS